MTIRVQVTCDARSCSNELDLTDAAEDPNLIKEGIAWLLKKHGWVQDTDANYHYCAQCFPKIKHELGL